MVVSYKGTSSLTVSSPDNVCRWDGRSPCHYEVWFLTLNHRASQRGFWFRYTIDSPATSHPDAKPAAQLWAAAFSRAAPDRNLGLKASYTTDEISLDGRDGFSIKIGDAFLSADRAIGTVRDAMHAIDWDLRFKPSASTYHHASKTLIRLTRPSSYVCSPNLDTRFSGSVSVDGERIIIDEEPGCQSHLWGRKHVDDWVWVHSNAFDKNPGTVFEGITARTRRAGRAVPPIQSLYLRHRGEELRFFRLRLGEQWERKLGMGYWSFAAMNANVYMEGSAQCRLRDMLQAAYLDPDGEPLYCSNSEVANLKIRLFRRTHGVRWRHIETIKAYSSAHLEHASRTRDPGVRLAFATAQFSD